MYSVGETTLYIVTLDPYNQYFMYQLHYLESPPKIAVDPKNYKCENCSEHETIYSVLTKGL